MKSNPLISVLLPVYNADKHIKKSVQSILNQTYANFEFIIINDGSTDNTSEIIRSFNDSRIFFIENDGNRGLIYSLNKGLKLARGKYIARMDADDISLPNRFKKQLSYMERNKGVIVCGTQIGFISDCDQKIRGKNRKYFLTNIEIKNDLIFHSCFAHPSVFIRKDVLIGNNIYYRADYKHCEDYRLWVDLYDYGEYANLEEKLLLYRISDSQISNMYSDIQGKGAEMCRKILVRKLLPNLDFEKGIDLQLVKQLKQMSSNKRLLLLFYFSLSKYNLKAFNYFITSCDLFKYSLIDVLRFFKRFIFRSKPLI